MSKPYIHAKSSARRYGGKPEDYIDIHEFFDSSKAALADVRHRAVLHSAFGIFLVEKFFGSTRTNSDNKVYSVRDIGEQHVMEDLGTIPTLEQWLTELPIEPWMMGKQKVKDTVNIPYRQSPLVTVVETDGSKIDPSQVFVDGLGGWQDRVVKAPEWPALIVKD